MKPAEWGLRGQTGELQTLIGDSVAAEADLALAVADYNRFLTEVDARPQKLSRRVTARLSGNWIPLMWNGMRLSPWRRCGPC